MRKKKNKTLTPAKKPTTLRDSVFGAMLLIVAGIMPLVVRLTVVTAAPELFALLGQEFYNDFFATYKGWALGIPAIIIAFYAIADWLIGGLTKDKLIAMIKPIPVAAACVFLVMALISTIFSSYRQTAWFGTVERSEGIFILFAYFIVYFAAMHYARVEKHAKLLMYGLAFSSIIMGIMGLSQVLGRDLVSSTGIGARLVMGRWGAQVNQVFTIAYGTLYNPNTFGKYSAMTAPVLLACAFVYDGRKWVRAVFLAGGVLMLIGVMGSSSVGGLVGIIAAVAVTVITFICRQVYQMRTRKKENNEGDDVRAGFNTLTWAVSGVVVAALVIGLIFVPAVNYSFNFLVGRVENAIFRETEPTYNYIFEDNRLTVSLVNEEKFTLTFLEEAYGPDGVYWHIYDRVGQPIPLISRTTPAAPADGGPPQPWPVTFQYNIPGHTDLNIQIWEERAMFEEVTMFVMIHGIAIFQYEGRSHTIASNFVDTIDLTIPVPAWGFQGNEDWGSGRGHIWSRTFPLMPARTIIGSGPDTYTLVFPQHDVVGKLLFHGDSYVPIDKAHNLYLQAWVTTGGISALALIFLFAYYLFTSFVSIVCSRMKEGMFVFGLRFGLLASISAFCMSAMATDSTIGSSGVFYLMLGLGFGVNYLVDGVYKAE